MKADAPSRQESAALRPGVRALRPHIVTHEARRTCCARKVSRAIDVSHAVHLARDAGIVALCYVASLPFTAVLLTGLVLPPSFLLPTAILLVALMVTPVNHWWAIIAATFRGSLGRRRGQHESASRPFRGSR
jgi:hypothetical protein